jgi:tetratricopeptide (TPR) repeat protein
MKAWVRTRPRAHAREGARIPRFSEEATYWKAKGDLKQADADFTRAIELKPNAADAYAHRGLVRLMSGRADEAQQDFIHCLKLNKNFRQSLERLIAETKQQMAERGSIR